MQCRRAARLLMAFALCPLSTVAISASPGSAVTAQAATTNAVVIAPVSVAEGPVVVLKTLDDAERNRLRTLIALRKAKQAAALTQEQRALVEAHEAAARDARHEPLLAQAPRAKPAPVRTAAVQPKRVKPAALPVVAVRQPLPVSPPFVADKAADKPADVSVEPVVSDAPPEVVASAPIETPAEPLAINSPDRSN